MQKFVFKEIAKKRLMDMINFDRMKTKTLLFNKNKLLHLRRNFHPLPGGERGCSCVNGDLRGSVVLVLIHL